MTVPRDGSRISVGLTDAVALDYAIKATKAFGLSPSRRVEFKKTLAQADLKEIDKKKMGKKAQSIV